MSATDPAVAGRSNGARLSRLGRKLWRALSGKKNRGLPFTGSGDYWEQRYAQGGNSGIGSYIKFAEFKAEVLNRFVSEHDVASVIEFGCGDGNQLKLAHYPRYAGFDVSKTVIAQCRQMFAGDNSKSFALMDEYNDQQAQLSLSLDVIYHLVEDEIYDQYMRTLFKAAQRYVIVFASNTDDNSDAQGTHVRHRKFTDWVDANTQHWSLIEHIPNRYPYEGDYRSGSFADFYIYQRG